MAGVVARLTGRRPEGDRRLQPSDVPCLQQRLFMSGLANLPLRTPARRIMAIRRRETESGVRYDVQWRLPDRSKRKKTFKTEREARQFEARLITSGATGEFVDPRGGKIQLRARVSIVACIATRPEREGPPWIRRQLATAHRAALWCMANRAHRP